jgi:phosphohistidine phosphatase
MELLLMRHAEAEDLAATDQLRRLTEKGRRQAESVGEYLSRQGITVDRVLSSPALRTMETAEIVARRLKTDVTPAPWALPGMSASAAIESLENFRHCKRVLLVGHQPDIGLLIAKLLGLRDDRSLHVRKASLFHLCLVSKAEAVLEAFVPCKLM